MFYLVWQGHVDFVMSSYADKGGKLKRKQFEGAMNELSRRQELDQALYWDYQSISKYSDRKLTTAEGLLLAQIAHGEYFSSKEWTRFIKQRPIKDAPLSWNDLRVFLCTMPTNNKNDRKQPDHAGDELEITRKRIRLDLEQSKIDEARARGTARMEQRMEYLKGDIAAARAHMLSVYEEYGAIAMIFDDGSDPSQYAPVKQEANYSADWVKVQMSEAEWRRLNESERQAALLKAKLLEKQLRKEMYGSDWLAERDRLAGDEAALAELDKQRRLVYEKAMKLRLLNMRNKGEINDFSDLGDQVELTEELEQTEEKLTADWVKGEMDEADWRKLSERERQEIIRQAKLAQRKLRAEMYGDEWLEQLARMNGRIDDEAELRRLKREEFDRRLKAMLFEKHREKESTVNAQNAQTVTTDATITIESNNETVHLAEFELFEDEDETRSKNNEKLDALCVDWVAAQMHEVDMRAMSEAERQAYLTKVKLAQRRARTELYGEEWQAQLAALEGDVEKQRQLEAEQRDLFNKRLKILMAGKSVKENNQDEQRLAEGGSIKIDMESTVEELTYFADLDIDEAEMISDVNEKVDTFTADWVAAEMKEVNLRAMSESERQAYLTKVKLAQRRARAELYGDEWQAQLAALDSVSASF